jgi:hypothetical protein
MPKHSLTVGCVAHVRSIGAHALHKQLLLLLLPAGNVNTQPVSWLARILYQGKQCYLRELNVHCE